MGSSGSKSKLSEGLESRVRQIFSRIDVDGSGTIDKAETMLFWKEKMPKLNTERLFKAVDTDGDGQIELNEWLDFWRVVKGSGHPESEIEEELDQLDDKQSWYEFSGVKSGEKKKID